MTHGNEDLKMPDEFEDMVTSQVGNCSSFRWSLGHCCRSESLRKYNAALSF